MLEILRLQVTATQNNITSLEKKRPYPVVTHCIYRSPGLLRSLITLRITYQCANIPSPLYPDWIVCKLCI